MATINVPSQARVFSNTNSSAKESAEYQQREIEELMRRNLRANCQSQGLQSDSFGNCKSAAQTPPTPDMPRVRSESNKPPSNSQSSSGSTPSLAKHKAEIIQRCGVGEDARTKITNIKDSEKDPILHLPALGERYFGPSWIVTYSTDTGNVVFGERQYERRECWIEKKSGEAKWK